MKALAILPLALLTMSGAFPTIASAQDNRSQTAQPAAQDDNRGLLGEPHAMRAAIDFVSKRLGDETGATGAKDGFYPELGNMVTGSGWISAGPGYRQHVLDGQAYVDVSTAVSWRAYKVVQGRFELPRLFRDRVTVGSQVLWQDATQVNYFGVGRDSLEDSRSEYRMKTFDTVGYAAMRPAEWLSINGRVGYLRRPSLGASAGPFQRGFPDTEQTFADDPVFALTEQPNYLHGGLSVIADTRDHRGHPERGGVYSAGWELYSDRDAGQFSFQRYQAEGLQFVPLVADRWTLALHGWTVLSTTSENDTIPFYLLPSLGGHNTLRGYLDYRFHDRDLLLANVESRWALMTHVDAAAFFDAGNVAARASDLNLSKRSYGAGVRLHARGTTFLRFDVAHSTEGWHFLLRMNDPFKLARLTHRTATTPFVP